MLDHTKVVIKLQLNEHTNQITICLKHYSLINIKLLKILFIRIQQFGNNHYYCYWLKTCKPVKYKF